MTSERIDEIEAALLSMCPDFAERLNDERDLYALEDGALSVSGLFAIFSHYVAARLEGGFDPALRPVFEYVENKITDDQYEVDTAVTTCFLENLMNRVPSTIAPSALVPLLGPKSREFCRGWDEFCGVKTDGLW